MINLRKGPKPAVLEDNAEAWTQELTDKIAANEEASKTLKSKYNHPDIKSALIDETHGKCAYCESKVRHVAHGDIEHVAPKSVHPNLSFEWTNLTFACPVCNNKKRNHEGVVDPYDGDPMRHFFFQGPLLLHKPGNEAAEFTETQLELNRPELLEKRGERITNLHKQFDNIAKTQNPRLKAVLREDIIRNETHESSEYTALARHFIPSCLEHMDE